MFARMQWCKNILQNARSVHRQKASVAVPVENSTAQLSIFRGPKKFSIGKMYEGFICTKVEFIPDFNMIMYQFRHDLTKSEYLHIDRNDPNNVFSINFRTTPFDSTGLPHILEHNVLCGSQKFPVRDPFFKMLNRSVATFMNAMTGPDYTMYPFSSMNQIDYTNLQSIYLDAVFKPNLKYMDFLQEGWRLENKNLADSKSDYTIKGVVYNEMKGAFSENASLFHQKFFNSILPDHTYGHVSGGDPLEIPRLTHTDLVAFHQKYYHPSNANFFSYGNFPLLPTLKYVSDQYLSDVKPIDKSYSAVPLQPRWTESRQMNIQCRYDNLGAPLKKQNQIAIGYLMNDINDVYETFVMSVITELLIKGPNSYFYKSLIEPNISGGYNQLTGYDSQVRDTLFMIGLQDLDAEDFPKVQSIFDRTIDEVIEKGFDPAHIDSVLHNLELMIKHQTSKFGLSLLFSLTPIWNHGGDLGKSVGLTEMMTQFKKDMAEPRFLQNKVAQYFKHNKHRLVMTMSPDTDYEGKFNAAENLLLEKKVKNLTEADKARVLNDAQTLSAAQKASEDTNILPCLQLKDISTEIEPIDLRTTRLNNIPTQICSVDTNDVTYVKGIFNASRLSHNQKLLLPLLACVVDQFGTSKTDFRQFDQWISSKTAGIGFSLNFMNHKNDTGLYDLGMYFRTHCLSKNVDAMFAILSEMFTQLEMNDVQRFQMLLENYVSNLSVGIANSGHLYAMQACNGLVTESGALKELLSGIEHVNTMKKYMTNNSPSDILNSLREIAKILFTSSPLRCALNISEATQENVFEQYKLFGDSLPNAVKTSSNSDSNIEWKESRMLDPRCQHTVMNIPVNYCATSLMTVPYGHADYAPLKVLAKILSAKYLLPVVREQNGAYGAGAILNSDGIFNFFSYRDPNSRKTLDTFEQSSEWLDEYLAKTVDSQILFEAKLGVLQKLDVPVASGDKGADEFRTDVTREDFAMHRKEVLAVDKENLQAVHSRYLKETQSRGVVKYVLGPGHPDLIQEKEKWTVSECL